jgi:hypothetical protein
MLGPEEHGDTVQLFHGRERAGTRVRIEDDGHRDPGLRRVLRHRAHQLAARILEPALTQRRVQRRPRVNDVVAVDDE